MVFSKIMIKEIEGVINSFGMALDILTLQPSDLDNPIAFQ